MPNGSLHMDVGCRAPEDAFVGSDSPENGMHQSEIFLKFFYSFRIHKAMKSAFFIFFQRAIAHVVFISWFKDFANNVIKT